MVLLGRRLTSQAISRPSTWLGPWQAGDRCSDGRARVCQWNFLNIPTNTSGKMWVRSGRDEAKYTEKCEPKAGPPWACIKPGICYRPLLWPQAPKLHLHVKCCKENRRERKKNRYSSIRKNTAAETNILKRLTPHHLRSIRTIVNSPPSSNTY